MVRLTIVTEIHSLIEPRYQDDEGRGMTLRTRLSPNICSLFYENGCDGLQRLENVTEYYHFGLNYL